MRKALTRKQHWAGLVLGLSLGMGMMVMPPAVGQSTDAITFYNYGIREYNRGNVEQAMEYFKRATARYPNYADAHYNMGSIHYQEKRYEEAKKAFQQTVDLNPTDNQAKYNLALTLERLDDREGAIRVFSQIPANDKKYSQARKKIDQIQAKMAQARPASQQAQPQQSAAGNAQSDLDRLSQLSQGGSVPGGPNPQGGYTLMDPNAKLSVQTFAKGFAGPTGMTIGPGGFMYVANYSKNAIYKVGATGDKVVFVEGEGLSGPIGLAFNPKSNEMYVANYLKNNVVKVSREGEVSIMASGLHKPYNLFFDAMNNVLYVSEQETNTVSKIDLPI